MKNTQNINELINYFRSQYAEVLFDEEKIHAAYQKNQDTQTFAIKVVSVFGGILASLAFTGFLFLTGIYRSSYALLGFGVAFVAVGIWISKKYNKIVLDTISISLFTIGFILLGLGLNALNIHEQHLYLTFIILALFALLYTRGYVLRFSTILFINGNVIALILSSNANLIHVYTASLAAFMCYYLLQEAKIVHKAKKYAVMYDSVRAAVVFSFLSGLILLGRKGFIEVSLDYLWVTSLVCITAILFLISRILLLLKVRSRSQWLFIYILAALTLLPTIFSPAISGAVLLVLLSFFVQYKTGFVTSILALTYFVSQYYYDLHFTLLTKSMLLMASGVFFIALYLFTHKKTIKP